MVVAFLSWNLGFQTQLCDDQKGQQIISKQFCELCADKKCFRRACGWIIQWLHKQYARAQRPTIVICLQEVRKDKYIRDYLATNVCKPFHLVMLPVECNTTSVILCSNVDDTGNNIYVVPCDIPAESHIHKERWHCVSAQLNLHNDNYNVWIHNVHCFSAPAAKGVEQRKKYKKEQLQVVHGWNCVLGVHLLDLLHTKTTQLYTQQSITVTQQKVLQTLIDSYLLGDQRVQAAFKNVVNGFIQQKHLEELWSNMATLENTLSAGDGSYLWDKAVLEMKQARKNTTTWDAWQTIEMYVTKIGPNLKMRLEVDAHLEQDEEERKLHAQKVMKRLMDIDPKMTHIFVGDWGREIDKSPMWDDMLQLTWVPTNGTTCCLYDGRTTSKWTGWFNGKSELLSELLPVHGQEKPVKMWKKRKRKYTHTYMFHNMQETQFVSKVHKVGETEGGYHSHQLPVSWEETPRGGNRRKHQEETSMSHTAISHGCKRRRPNQNPIN